MPFAIDEAKMNPGSSERIVTLDPAKPPVKNIPHLEFPKCVYMHPVDPFFTVEHRNARHELVDEEVVPTEHLSKTVANADELTQALAEGWREKAYIPKAPTDPKANLYRQTSKKKAV